YLTEVVMGRWRLGLAEERLVPPEAGGDVPHADDRPCALHDASTVARRARRASQGTPQYDSATTQPPAASARLSSSSSHEKAVADPAARRGTHTSRPNTPI